MQAIIRTSINTVRKHLYIAATVQGVLVAVVIISLGAMLPLFRSLAPPAASAVDLAAQKALREQQIADRTETHVTRLEAQRQVQPSQTSGPGAVEAANRNALKDQWIAAWTEINVPLVEAQGPVQPGYSAAQHALREQQIAEWTEINVTQLEAQGH